MLPDRIAAVILQEDKMLLVRAKDSDLYITPGGKLEPGESHEEALTRELREELNVELKSREPYCSYATTQENTKEEQTIYCYLVSISGTIAALNEVKEYGWFDRQHLLAVAKGIQKHLIPKLIQEKLLKEHSK